MHVRRFMLAAALAAILGPGHAAFGQYPSMGGAPAPYPSMMAPGPYMGGPPQGMPGPSPYAPSPYAPASYAGMGGPEPMSPMGPMPTAPGMGDMGAPIGPGGSSFGEDICDVCGWTNKYFAFGEFLYLRPRNAEVAYAVPISGAAIATGNQVQVGPTRVADPDYGSAFRAGIGMVMSPTSSFSVTYTQFDRNTFDTLSLPGTGAVVRSLVNQPNPLAAGGNGLDAAALLQTQFQLLDADYKGMWSSSPDHQLAYVVGARYGNLEQHFGAGFTAPSGFQHVLAESEFDGGGLRLGLEGLRLHPTTQFFAYGKGYTSLLAGSFRGRYQYTENNVSITDTSFNVGRLVTMFDLEAGVGWQNFTGNLRFSMGYMFSAWYNTVRVNEFINAVQNNNFVDPSTNFSGLTTFDGLTSKIEFLW